MNMKATALAIAVVITTATAVYALNNRIESDRNTNQVCAATVDHMIDHKLSCKN